MNIPLVNDRECRNFWKLSLFFFKPDLTAIRNRTKGEIRSSSNPNPVLLPHTERIQRNLHLRSSLPLPTSPWIRNNLLTYKITRFNEFRSTELSDRGTGAGIAASKLRAMNRINDGEERSSMLSSGGSFQKILNNGSRYPRQLSM